MYQNKIRIRISLINFKFLPKRKYLISRKGKRKKILPFFHINILKKIFKLREKRKRKKYLLCGYQMF